MRPLGTGIVRAAENAVTVSATAAAYVAGAVLVSLMLLTTADVAGRYFFNRPITGVFDFTHFAVLIMTFLGLAYCGVQNGHVVIELFTQRLGRRTRRRLNRLVNLAGAVLFAVIAWRSVVQSIDVREFKESSQLMQVPFFPFYWLLGFGALLFALVMLLRVFVPEAETEPRTNTEKST